MKDRLPYVWDYEIDTETFFEILAGKRAIGRLNQDWAATRMLEYAPYKDIVHQIGYRRLIENWPHWRKKSVLRAGGAVLIFWFPRYLKNIQSFVMVNHAFYFEQLYPFQDQVLKVIRSLDTGFYLTGGTAASRGYLHHRFSDDLDLFVDDEGRFGLWIDRLIQGFLHTHTWECQVNLREERYARLLLTQNDITLKAEMAKQWAGC